MGAAAVAADSLIAGVVPFPILPPGTLIAQMLPAERALLGPTLKAMTNAERACFALLFHGPRFEILFTDWAELKRLGVPFPAVRRSTNAHGLRPIRWRIVKFLVLPRAARSFLRPLALALAPALEVCVDFSPHPHTSTLKLAFARMRWCTMPAEHIYLALYCICRC